MSQTTSTTLFGAVCKLLKGRSADDLPDGELVRCFVAGSEEAFAVLVRRHGPMVLGVCRRVLRHQHDAEDAFQATFLTLARKAVSLRERAAVGGWLHRTARRIAVRSSTNRARGVLAGPAPEVAEEADPLTAVSGRELLCVLDEELERLPVRFRQPLLLYYLEGKTQEEAARQLGCPRGTLKARLERGRELLHARLTRRGVTLPAAMLLASLAPTASAVPTALTAVVTHAAFSEVLGAAPGRPAVVPARFWGTFALLAGLGILTAGLGLVAHGPRDEQTARKDASTGLATHDRPRLDRYGDPLPPGAVARLGTVRFRHEGGAGAMAFSPDGRILAAMDDSKVILWEAATGREVRRLPGRGGAGAFKGMGFTPDGKSLVLMDNRQDIWGELNFWDVGTGKVVRTLPIPCQKLLIGPTRLRFSPDGKRLALLGFTGKVLVLDVASGKMLHLLGTPKVSFRELAFSPDGKTLALGTFKPSVQFWDVTAGKLLRGIEGHGDQDAGSVAFSPDGRTLAWGSGDRVVLSDVTTGREVGRLEARMHSVHSLEFTPDGKTLVSGSQDGKVRIWDVASRKLRHTLDGRLWIGYSMALSRDGKTVALGAAYNAIRLWDVGTGKELFTAFRGHDGGVNRVVFSPDGKTLISGGDNRQTRLWDTTTWQQTQLLPASARELALATDGRWLATVPSDKTVRVWDLAAAKEVLKIAVPDTYEIKRVAFLPGGRELVTVDEKWDQPRKLGTASHLVVWEGATGRPLRRFSLPDVQMSAFALAPDGKRAIVGSRGYARLYDLHSGAELLTLPTDKMPVTSVSFAPDGQTLLVGRHDGHLALWERATGKIIFHTPRHGRSVGAVAFAPGGRLIASAEGNPDTDYTYQATGPITIHLWDAATGAEVERFQGLSGNVTSLAFSPDGTKLVSGHKDSTILVWDPRPAARKLATLVKTPGVGELPALWDALGGEPGPAHRALWRLAANPPLAVPFLKAHLRPATEPDPARVRRLIADLASDRFAVRERAAKELGDLGEQVVPALRQALERKPALEVRRRLEALRDAARVVRSSETLRALRAVQALEPMASKEAGELLNRLSKGDPAAMVTREARAALERLAGRNIGKQVDQAGR